MTTFPLRFDQGRKYIFSIWWFKTRKLTHSIHQYVHHYVHYAMIKGGKILFVSPSNSGLRKSLISSSSQAQGANTVTVKAVKSISLS